MVTINEIQNSIKKELSGLNAIIEDTLRSSSPLMQQVVQNFLRVKGKQIRPILVILSGKYFGADTDRVLHAGAAIELLHNASLIHDDVIDESRERRGRPTINRVWDNHIAVLVGDFFVSGALHCAEYTKDFRVITAMSSLGRALSLGEIEQIDNARSRSVDERTYLEIIRKKTASLFCSCVEVGGYAAGAPEEQLRTLMQYAEMLGLCFQIKDDIFDYFDNKEVGKPTGNDLREGKMTLPLIYALSRTDAPRHEEMVALSHKDILDTDDIATLIAYAKEQGGIDYAYARMEEIKQEADALITTLPYSESLDSFRLIFDYIIARRK
ncbi:MAG: polyprenyl synthetase family protein [Bacteroidales bacterium]|nr:polyprenyl synthetase family protein [Bacteroidales bacterium]